MHKLDNICSSSVYGFVLRFAPERGQMPHAPPKLVPKRAIFGYFFANERPVASSIRHRWKRNYLKMLFILCTRGFIFLHRLGEPVADYLYEQCPFKSGPTANPGRNLRVVYSLFIVMENRDKNSGDIVYSFRYCDNKNLNFLVSHVGKAPASFRGKHSNMLICWAGLMEITIVFIVTCGLRQL